MFSKYLKIIHVLLWVLMFPCGLAANPLDRIQLSDGFEINYFAKNVPDARSLSLGEKGTVFVGSRKAGKVYALQDRNLNGAADQQWIIADHLDMPNGVTFLKGDLYVAEKRRILRFPSIEGQLDHPPMAVAIYDRLPKKSHHGWRYLAAGPDGWLYVSIGAPCNICEPPLPYASIHRLKPDGSSFELFAQGVRNSVGLTWHPETRVLWFTDNGRDWMGDDVPPDELNRAPEKGLHFGYPYQHGMDIADPQYGGKETVIPLTPPVQELDAHVAPLGLQFYTGKMFPKSYRGKLFVVEHGSWNRSEPVGYRIVILDIQDGEVVGKEVFAHGWLDGNDAWGRPVDVLVMPDGALLVSDDARGVIYRISYK